MGSEFSSNSAKKLMNAAVERFKVIYSIQNDKRKLLQLPHFWTHIKIALKFLSWNLMSFFPSQQTRSFFGHQNPTSNDFDKYIWSWLSVNCLKNSRCDGMLFWLISCSILHTNPWVMKIGKAFSPSRVKTVSACLWIYFRADSRPSLIAKSQL